MASGLFGLPTGFLSVSGPLVVVKAGHGAKTSLQGGYFMLQSQTFNVFHWNRYLINIKSMVQITTHGHLPKLTAVNGE